MRRGQIVRCVDRGTSTYLTDGGKYTVVSGQGDVSICDPELIIEGDNAFELVDDVGEIIFCRGLRDSSHAVWELVS